MTARSIAHRGRPGFEQPRRVAATRRRLALSFALYLCGASLCGLALLIQKSGPGVLLQAWRGSAPADVLFVLGILAAFSLGVRAPIHTLLGCAAAGLATWATYTVSSSFLFSGYSRDPRAVIALCAYGSILWGWPGITFCTVTPALFRRLLGGSDASHVEPR